MERLMERHLSMAKEWFPHQMVDWSKSETYEPDYVWSVEDCPDATTAVRSALFVNLLTEDNLPYYTLALDHGFGIGDHIWGEWGRRWTAEEGRHAIVIRDWVTSTRIIDPVKLERARMSLVSQGWFPGFTKNAAEGMCYVTLQELSTRIAHRNTGQAINDPTGRAILTQVAADENLHFLFYRDLATAAFEIIPDEMVKGLASTLKTFEMPGTGVPGFTQHAYDIALARIFDMTIYYENVLVPVVQRHWKIETMEGLSAEGEIAREEVIKQLAAIKKKGTRFEAIREAMAPSFVLAAN
jgi:acyl-[acyl-carrier-protein] desaturase